MKITIEKDLHFGELAFIATWWALLVLFAGFGSGYLAILWIAIISVYLIFHPDLLAPKGEKIHWSAHTAEHFFELLAATLVYAGAITFCAWYIASSDGKLESPDDPMFYIIAFAFLFMSVAAMSGIVSHLFFLSGSHSMLPRIYFLSTFLLSGGVKLLFPNWMFTKALSEITHAAHVYGGMAAIASFLAYYLLKNRLHFLK